MCKIQIKWNKQNPFYFFLMEPETARSQMTSGRNPTIYLQKTSLDVTLFYLFSSYYLLTICLYQEGFLLTSWVVNIMWTVDRLTYLSWVMTNNLDTLTNEINVLAVVAYLIIEKITVRSKILLLLHISHIFILFSFLVTISLKTDAFLFYLIGKMKNVYVETVTGMQKYICCIFKHI